MTEAQEGNKKNKREKATAAKRQYLLETAVLVFLEKGYHQTGIRDIAERAGVSLGNLYNHFPSKEAVLVEIAKIEAEEIKAYQTILSGSKSALHKLEKFAKTYLSHNAEIENVILNIEITSEAIRSEEIAKIYEENYNILVHAIEACLLEAEQRNEIALLPDRKAFAYFLLSSIEKTGERICFEERKMKSKDFKTLWHMLSHGLQIQA